MRKWIFIVLAVLAVLGAGTHFIGKPRRGTIDYHKKQYVKAQDAGRLERWVMSHTPDSVGRALIAARMKRQEFHRDALVELGYLEERRCFVTNRAAGYVASRIIEVGYSSFIAGTNADVADFVAVSEVKTNSFALVAPRTQMRMWEKWIRQHDVPEK